MVGWKNKMKCRRNDGLVQCRLARENLEEEEEWEGTLGDGEETLGDTGGVMLEDLNWRVEKLRLEEQNVKRLLKSKPRFLPFDECRKWVQAFSRWESEEEWTDWIYMGEKRNSYIPVRVMCFSRGV
jgi:hypothetical protein